MENFRRELEELKGTVEGLRKRFAGPGASAGAGRLEEKVAGLEQAMDHYGERLSRLEKSVLQVPAPHADVPAVAGKGPEKK